MEAITNVTRNQEELRAFVERPRVDNEQPELMFEDVSVGKPHPNVAMKFFGPNFNDPRANDYHVHNQVYMEIFHHLHHHREIMEFRISLLGI